MKDLILRTPTTTSDSIDGLNDGNIETYKNTLLLSLTKEELQNSTDQPSKDENGNPKRVIVEFNEFFLDKNSFPEYEKTVGVYEAERTFWDGYQENDKKAKKFFDDAIKNLKGERIRCLRISDFNTTGLSGIHAQKSSPWNNLVKNKGVSDKPSYCGGSFGIGKDAAFACSQLRIVFYSTKNEEGEEGFQGCMKLPNYRDGGTTYTGRNFYCLNSDDDRCNPIEKSVSLDPSYVRTEIGMDKFILGLDEKIGIEDLKSDIFVSSINNFLTAFFFDTLEIKYGESTINKSYLESNEFADIKDKLFAITKENYETLKNYDDVIQLSMFEENDIQIYIKLDPSYSRKASVIRQNGMKVFDRGHISARIGFNAVVYLRGNKANAFFKKLEGQEHNSWSNERADNPALAKEKQDVIFNAIRDKVKELNGVSLEGSVDSDGLGEYLPFAYVTGKKDKIETISNEVQDTRKKAKKRKKRVPPLVNDEETHYVEDENGNLVAVQVYRGVNPTPPGPNPIPPVPNDITIENEGNGTSVSQTEKDGDFISKKEIPSSYLHLHLFKKQQGYCLKVKSEKSCKKGYFEIAISGEDQSDNINAKISSATINGVEAPIKANKILFNDLNENETLKIDFSIEMPGEWALEVKAHESEN